MSDPEIPRRRFLPRSRLGMTLVAAGLLAIGGATGAAVIARTRPPVSMAPSTPTAISALKSSGIVTLRGRVAEVYGNKFVLDDGTGRTLVDLGPEGDGGVSVTTKALVTVQGRFERGAVHAAFLVEPDGRVIALGPLAGPPHGRHHGPDCRLDQGPSAPPAPPPPRAEGKAPPSASGSTSALSPSLSSVEG